MILLYQMVGEVTKCPTCRRLVVRGPQCSCGTIYHRLVTHHHQCAPDPDFKNPDTDLSIFLRLFTLEVPTKIFTNL